MWGERVCVCVCVRDLVWMAAEYGLVDSSRSKEGWIYHVRPTSGCHHVHSCSGSHMSGALNIDTISLCTCIHVCMNGEVPSI